MKTPNSTIDIFDYTEEELPLESSNPVPSQSSEGGVVQTDEILGQGGMGVVYKGVQSYPARSVAIKKLRFRNPRTEYALFTEAMITGQLSHPNIIPIHLLNPYGKDGPEVVMPRIQGQTLLSLLENDAISTKKGLFVLDQICNALHYAHSQNVLHRDIKPENIMVGDYGEVYLLDWGIAIDQDTPQVPQQHILGTPSYMAPEMCTPESSVIDERTDVYLCGATLHHILTKEPRHMAPTIEATILLAGESQAFVYPSEIFISLANLANQACHRDPDQRPQSIQLFQKSLQQSLQHWETLHLIHSGYEALETLRDSTSTQEGYPSFMKARILFEKSLSTLPNHLEAQNGIIESLELMITLLLKENQFTTAASLVDELQQLLPTHPKIAQLSETISNKQKVFSTLAQRVQENDLGVSQSTRVQIAILLSITMLVITGYVFFERIILSEEGNNHVLIGTIALPISVLLISLPFYSSIILHNQASRRAFNNIFSTLCMILANRVVGILYLEKHDAIMTIDLGIVVLFWSHMVIGTRKALPFLFLHILFFFLCIWNPQYTFWCITLGALFTTVGTAWLWATDDLY